MQPAARYAAAIYVLDRIIAGDPAERELTDWARKNRYAGSKDRAAVRDIVFECLRNLRSFQHSSGLSGGRGAIVGLLQSTDDDLSSVFSDVGYAPSGLSDDEVAVIDGDKEPISLAASLNIPDWIMDLLDAELQREIPYLKNRAPIDLRVNLSKTNIVTAQKALLKDGIETTLIDANPTALRVVGQTRKILQTDLYKTGKIELQDAGSQALINAIEFPETGSVLDYCAGGGGKSLAIAALNPSLQISAYDISVKRMSDLPERSKRAGAKISVLKHDPLKSDQMYDTIILDVPCSGSGSWRRSPDAKWKFTQDKLSELNELQANILSKTSTSVMDGGRLVYMTCSVFREENENQIKSFLNQNPDWKIQFEKHLSLSNGTDGFYICSLQY